MRKLARGFTILEVQVALLLMLIGILAVVGLAPMGMRGMNLAEDSTLAIGYAHHFMEVTRALPYSHQTLNWPSPLPGPVKKYITNEVPGAKPNFWQYDVKISLLPTNLEIHQIEVTIYWSEPAASYNPITGKQTIDTQYRLVGYCARTN